MSKQGFLNNPALVNWLPYFVLSVALPLLGFIAVQQNYRQSANDTQIQMAEYAATALTQGATTNSIMPTAKVNMRTRLAPFLILVDENYQVTAASGTLDGHNIIPPIGAFQAAKSNSGKDTTQSQENRITWQPADNVREAAVIEHYPGGYVVAARSLREVEARIADLTAMTGITITGLLLFGVVGAILTKKWSK